jgi:hypothetical protein
MEKECDHPGQCGSRLQRMKPSTLYNYFAERWQGRVPWRVLFWRDMLVLGTLVNLAATLLAVVAAIQGATTVVVALLHFAPLPYNLFLFAALHRSSRRPDLAVIAAVAWLALVMIV